MPWGIVARYAGLLGAGIAIGWTTNGWRLDSVLSRERERYAVETRILAQTTATMINQARQREQDAATNAAARDRQHTQELANAKSELDALRDDVDAGNQQLHVNADCPAAAAPASVPGPNPAPGVGNGPAARLADSARRDYFRLRERVGLMEIQLRACQAHIVGEQ